jgi:formylglycine-generating enzyme required for sulfatase activity/serine/threonine protein kinase
MPLDTSRVEELFFAAQQIANPDERRAWLEAACAEDQVLRSRVEALLGAAAEASQFLNRPAVELAGSAADVTQGFDGSSVTPSRVRRPKNGDELSFLQPTSRADSLGRLGHYEVLEVIGQGGFGIVLRAFDEKLHRVVALKVLAPELAANGSARKRFVREARTAAAVKNEHVVGIYGVEENAQPPYLAMEMIDGKSLQEKIDEQGPLSLTEILRIGLQMAEGLAAAHKQGLVHRDIKPANILLENGVERVKITDFGLARAVDDASVTQSGTVAGTPMYMSPEQAEGLAIDHRSDLFSLGTVLYAMCTGHSAFRASGTHAVLKRVIEASPRPIREVNGEIPEWLADIIGKLHSKWPDDRFQTADEVAELLGQHLAHEQNPSQNHRPAAVVAAIAPRSKDFAASETKPSLPEYNEPSSNAWPIAVIVIAIVALLILMPLIFGVVTVAIHYFRSHQDQTATISQGVLSVELNDPRIEFRIDRHGPNLTAVSNYQIPIEEGPHRVWLKLNDVEFETDPFITLPGKQAELQLEIESNRAMAKFDGQLLGMRQLAGKPTAVELGNGTIALPGTGSNSLLGNYKHFTGAEPPLAIAPFDAAKAKEHQEAWAKYLGVEVEFTNSLGMKMRLIPPGKYLMGTPEAEMPDRPSEGPQREVTITRAFYMGTSEVTQAQYQRLIGQNPSEYANTGKFSAKVNGMKTDLFPVEALTWDEAAEFCRKLSDSPAEKSGRRYRLPTEAEWEYACRAGTQGKFNVGDVLRVVDARFDNLEVNRTGPVATFPANAFGLHDMHGNVFEWCRDWFSESYHDLPAMNPEGPATGTARVVRGGNYGYKEEYCRSAARDKFLANTRRSGIGFRVVCPIEMPEETGWVQLFNGKDLSGWKTHPEEPGDWKVENGAIVGANKPSYLFTERGDYTDFHLRCEVQINAGGDGGIIGRAPFSPPGPTGMPGYEAQVYAGKPTMFGWGTGAIGTTTPKLGWHTLKEVWTDFPTDTWVPLELIVRGHSIETRIAGKPAANYTDTDRLYTKGHIALQQSGEKTRVQYRNLEIKELSADDQAEAALKQ